MALVASFLCQQRPHRSRAHCMQDAARSQKWCSSFVWDNQTQTCNFLDASVGRARAMLRNCIAANRSKFGTTRQTESVAIVETLTANLLSNTREPTREEHRRCAHNIRCWAARHGYQLVLHPVAADELRSGYSLAYGPRRLYAGVPFDKLNDVRHRVIESQYLRREYSHVLHIDSDTIALNGSRSLRPFLRADAAISLQVRENGEVAAATYLARRSAEAACFLRLWDEMGHATHRNPIPMTNTE